MPRKAVTLVEVLVVLAILATLCWLLTPAFMAAREHHNAETQTKAAREPPETSLLDTVRHDGHLWVIGWSLDGGSHATHFVHHPDCPCRGRQAEKEMR